MEFLYKFCYGLTTLLGFAQGLFVLSKNPRSRVNVIWAMMSFSVALWALEATCFFEPDYRKALFGWRLFNAAAIFIPVLFTHFCLALLNKPLKESRVTIAGYVLAICIGSLSWTPWYIPSVSPKLIFPNYVNPGPLYVVFTILFFFLVFYSHWLLFRHLREQTRERQNQIKYVALATIIGYACGSTTFLLVYDIPFNPWPSLFTFIYAAVITYAIVKHHLMDIKVAITRTGVLLATYLIVLGIPFLVGWWGREWLEQAVGRDWWLVPLGLCTVLATVGPFAYAYLRRQAEARLLREQRRYQRTLQLAARGMTRVRDVNKLANLITRLVSRTVRLTHASLFLWDPPRQRYFLSASHGPKRLALQSRYELETSHPLIQRLTANRRAIAKEEFTREPQSFVNQELEQLEASLAVPGMIEDHLVGFLALGSKVSGEGYSTDDLHAFATLANEAAIAIENATSYEELLKMNQQLKVASDRLLLQERQAAAGQFAAGMAHEIKNPLSAIKTFAQYLPERYRDPKFRETFFRIVQSQIDRINELVLELSAFAKPSPLQLQAVQLSELVKEILSFLSNQCLQQKVEIRNTVKPNGLLVTADPQQLRQVLLNLFLNSLEAMADGGRLEVASQPNGSFLTLRISDTGCGIGPEEQRQVWDPFFTTKERGMGLGLAIVKGIIERHGGRIHLSSAPGKGTTVEIALPTTERVKTSPQP